MTDVVALVQIHFGGKQYKKGDPLKVPSARVAAYVKNGVMRYADGVKPLDPPAGDNAEEDKGTLEASTGMDAQAKTDSKPPAGDNAEEESGNDKEVLADPLSVLTAVQGVSKPIAQAIIAAGFDTLPKLKKLKAADLDRVQGLNAATKASVLQATADIKV